MQKFEDYGLLGSRPAQSPGELEALSARMVRQTLDGMSRTAPAPPVARTVKRPTRNMSPPFERRPLTTVTHGGSARLGGDLVWALRELRSADSLLLRAEMRRDPASWAAAIANPERLTAQLGARQAGNGQFRC